jgi:hypothetical protein
MAPRSCTKLAGGGSKRMPTLSRRFSLGLGGVERKCASQSEKQRSPANQSATGGGGATGYKWSLAGFRAASMVSRGAR